MAGRRLSSSRALPGENGANSNDNGRFISSTFMTRYSRSNSRNDPPRLPMRELPSSGPASAQQRHDASPVLPEADRSHRGSPVQQEIVTSDFADATPDDHVSEQRALIVASDASNEQEESGVQRAEASPYQENLASIEDVATLLGSVDLSGSNSSQGLQMARHILQRVQQVLNNNFSVLGNERAVAQDHWQAGEQAFAAAEAANEEVEARRRQVELDAEGVLRIETAVKAIRTLSKTDFGEVVRGLKEAGTHLNERVVEAFKILEGQATIDMENSNNHLRESASALEETNRHLKEKLSAQEKKSVESEAEISRLQKLVDEWKTNAGQRKAQRDNFEIEVEHLNARVEQLEEGAEESTTAAFNRQTKAENKIAEQERELSRLREENHNFREDNRHLREDNRILREENRNLRKGQSAGSMAPPPALTGNMSSLFSNQRPGHGMERSLEYRNATPPQSQYFGHESSSRDRPEDFLPSGASRRQSSRTSELSSPGAILGVSSLQAASQGVSRSSASAVPTKRALQLQNPFGVLPSEVQQQNPEAPSGRRTPSQPPPTSPRRPTAKKTKNKMAVESDEPPPTREQVWAQLDIEYPRPGVVVRADSIPVALQNSLLPEVQFIVDAGNDGFKRLRSASRRDNCMQRVIKRERAVETGLRTCDDCRENNRVCIAIVKDQRPRILRLDDSADRQQDDVAAWKPGSGA